MNIIEASNITKHYGTVLALDNVSFNVAKNSIFGLLGPNGAGKTTLVKAMLDTIHYNKGDFIINKISSKQTQSRNSVAYLSEKFSFFPFFTVENTLKFFQKIYRSKTQQPIFNLEEALDRTSIIDLRKRKIKTLSKGQLQRLGIASMLLSCADIFIFDEPFSGLDPIGIKDIKDIFKVLKERGKTIFINSHILSEMEQICDEVAILDHGKLLTLKKIEEIKNSKQSLEDFFYTLIKESNHNA